MVDTSMTNATFARDDLLARLRQTGATVQATPVVQQRRVLANLLISLAQVLVFVAFYYWLFRRQRAMMAGGLFGGGKMKPVVLQASDSAPAPGGGRMLLTDGTSLAARRACHPVTQELAWQSC
jgi:ATP-dependent Zn protease